MQNIIFDAMKKYIADYYGSNEAEDPCYDLESLAKAIDDAIKQPAKEPKKLKEVIVLGKIEEGRCPYCGETNIDYDPIKFVDEQMAYYPATCTSCKRKFEEWYEMNYIGHNCGDNLDIEAIEGMTIVMEKVDK